MVTNNIISLKFSRWEWFEKQEIRTYQLKGKYVFFSTDRDQLVSIVLDELNNNNFHCGKIPLEGMNDGDYALCLYYENHYRNKELTKKYEGIENLRYIGWK
jgi:protein-arginine kinase activator protein McsA|tara:strand:+ start:626 stop:928 length:303 start_codon:yes stop_codon:yes gene_type:complete